MSGDSAEYLDGNCLIGARVPEPTCEDSISPSAPSRHMKDREGVKARLARALEMMGRTAAQENWTAYEGWSAEAEVYVTALRM